MPSINLDLNYFDHRKTVRLVGLLGKGSEVLPIKLWCYCGRHHAEDGKLIGYSTQEIESIAGWWGKTGEMIKAMENENIKLLKKIPNGWEINNWNNINGHLVTYHIRAKTASMMRWGSHEKRLGVIDGDDATSNATSIKNDASSNALSYLTNITNKQRVDGFGAFWASYPRKIGKGAAEKAWNKIHPSQELLNTILKAVADQKRCEQWRRDSGQFIPHPTTWLNQRRWEDETEAVYQKPKIVNPAPVSLPVAVPAICPKCNVSWMKNPSDSDTCIKCEFGSINVHMKGIPAEKSKELT